MKLKLNTAIAGPAVSYRMGDVVDFPEAEAKRHIANGNGVVFDGDIPLPADVRKRAYAAITQEEFQSCNGDGERVDALITSKAALMQQRAASEAVTVPALPGKRR